MCCRENWCLENSDTMILPSGKTLGQNFLWKKRYDGFAFEVNTLAEFWLLHSRPHFLWKIYWQLILIHPYSISLYNVMEDLKTLTDIYTDTVWSKQDNVDMFLSISIKYFLENIDPTNNGNTPFCQLTFNLVNLLESSFCL